MKALAALSSFRGRAPSAIGAPVVVFLLLAMVVVPLPALALDFFFTLNIALSLVVMLAVVYVMRPLDFTVFPTVLLLATLFRLALNVASTRVVLLSGHEGPGAAGQVIEAFGNFVIGGNYAVGLVVFLILTIINFAVITKGAGRVSEVSARFTLDAMPGRRMAIDADLNAGLLTRDEAKARREEVREEADFYGAMDGASKFVKGDAVAGLLILFVNVLGGVGIGTMAHGLSFGEAFQVYALLTIGDGLVAQIPALLLSTAVAILVTRMSRAQAIGGQMNTQLVGDGRALAMAAGLMGLIGLVLFVASWVSPFTALLQRQINWHDNAAYTIAVVPGLCMTYAAGAYLLVPFQASWLSLWLPLALLLARLSERPAIRPNSR